MRKILLFTLGTIVAPLLLLSQISQAQGGLISNVAMGTSSNNYVRALPGATIQTCVNTGVLPLTCTTPVLTYSDPALSYSVTPVADANGNYSFYVNVGSTTNFVTMISAAGYNAYYQAQSAVPITIESGFNPAVPGPIGGTTPSTGKFTILTAASMVDTALGTGTNPVCPNGVGGALTTSGCVGGGVGNVVTSGTTTAGYLPMFSSSTAITNSQLDDGATLPDRLTYTGIQGLMLSNGPLTMIAEGFGKGALLESLTPGLRIIPDGGDSTYAFQLAKTNNTTVVFDVDTTNGRVGINTATPADALDVAGVIHATGNISTTGGYLQTDLGLYPVTAGSGTLGSTASPFSAVYIGGAPLNNIKITGTATSSRQATLPDGASGTVLVGTITLTAATSDSLTMQGVTTSSHCTFSPSNATATTATILAYYSVTTNTFTLTHAATVGNGATYGVMCTSI